MAVKRWQTRRWPERPRWRAGAIGALVGMACGLAAAGVEYFSARPGGPIFGFLLLLPNVPLGIALLTALFAVCRAIAPVVPAVLEPLGGVVYLGTLVLIGPAFNFGVTCFALGWCYERFGPSRVPGGAA